MKGYLSKLGKVFSIVILFVSFVAVSSYETVYAVNYGSQAVDYVDVTGVLYKKDSSKCKSNEYYVMIGDRNEPRADWEFYRNVCSLKQSINTISLPLTGNGRYILVIKFSKWKRISKTNLFLNQRHHLLHNFTKPLRYVTHTELFMFNICGDRLYYKNENSPIAGNTTEIQFNHQPIYGDLDLSALGLFKEDNGVDFPILSKYVNNIDEQDALLDCRYNKVFPKSTPISNITILLNLTINNIVQKAASEDTLDQSEI